MAPHVGACEPPAGDDTLVRMLTLVLVLALKPAGVPCPPPPSGAGEWCVIAPLGGGGETAFGGEECDRRTLPASTFKIPHALIALDTGVVTDQTVMTWDGRRKTFLPGSTI